ncbi:MAG: cupin domain-containing protein [Pirellulales bacterium]|nr:cupin domain-containing protein [Pirellulales bacterium]
MSSIPTPTASMRSAYGEALVEVGRTHPDVMVLDADLSKATKTSMFADAYPERFFNIGIAEQNMTTVAAGLATCGKTPFATSLAVFSTMRACEQVRTSVALTNLNVKIVGFYGGLCTAENGPTHQCIADIGVMTSLPNMTVLAPADAASCKACVHWAADHKGPVYLRGLRDGEPVIYEENTPLDVAKIQIHREGKDAAILANGFMLHRALEAAGRLAEQGIHVTVADVICIKPIDQRTLLEISKNVPCVLTVEEHNVHGGLGTAVASVLAQNHPLPMHLMGVPDVFSGSGRHDSLLAAVGLTTEKIVENTQKLIRGSKGNNNPMGKYTIHERDVESVSLPGRDHKMVVKPENLGSDLLCAGVAVFPAGQHAPPHVHDAAEEILHVLSGKGRMYFDGVPEPIEPGTFMLAKQGVEHSLEADEGEDLKVFYVFSPPVKQGSYDRK